MSKTEITARRERFILAALTGLCGLEMQVTSIAIESVLTADATIAEMDRTAPKEAELAG